MFGTDEAFCRCQEQQLPTVAGSDLTGHGEVHICVDDQSTVYVNGQNVGETTVSQWETTEMFAFEADCSSPTTYAIDGVDNAGVSAIIANFNHCGEVLVTAPHMWKCSTSCDDGWEQVLCD